MLGSVHICLAAPFAAIQKETPTAQASALKTLYEDIVTSAIDKGDVKEMSSVRQDVLAHIARSKDLERLLPALDSAISSKGGIIRPLYAVTIQDVLARGNAAEISSLKAEVDAYSRLISNSSAHIPITPYGQAIQDAKARGDAAEVARLTAHAEALLAKLKA